ncbi:MAG TPA: hypothetical protein VF956_06505 [Candidatus Dormibacteraeota bacterium]
MANRGTLPQDGRDWWNGAAWQPVAKGGRVDGGVLTHFDIKGDASSQIASSAVRFKANATCHD